MTLLPVLERGFTWSEQHRAECEARHWLRLGYGTPDRIGELMLRVAAKRGQAAADALRLEMRRQAEVLKGAGQSGDGRRAR